MTLYSKILSVKDMNYVQITGLWALCPIMWKTANYAQNYAYIII